MNHKQTKNFKEIFLIFYFCFTSFLTVKTFQFVDIQHFEIKGSELFSKETLINNSSLTFPKRLIFINTKLIENELKDNLSLKNISKEINETKFWIRQNRSKLRKSEIDDITRRLNNREFISFKLGKNFISSFKYFVKNKNLWKNLKNFIFLISPKYILKKYMWYQ